MQMQPCLKQYCYDSIVSRSWRRRVFFLCLSLWVSLSCFVTNSHAQLIRSGVRYRDWVTSARVCGAKCEVPWRLNPSVDWCSYAQGEYVGRARTPHVPEYRLRVDDQLAFTFRLTREESSKPYELQVGDRIRVESLTGDSGSGRGEESQSDNLSRELIIQPDGTISLPLLGQVRAAKMTVDGLRLHLEKRYKNYYKVPAITITPLNVNTKLQDLLDSVDARQGVGGLQYQVTLTPAGKIYMPGLGAVCAQGLTLEELKYEIDARYSVTIPGVAVTPVLEQRAPRFVFVLGEVVQPGRFEMSGPTTLMAALAQAGSWNPGANLRQIVVFRRDSHWRLVATMLDIRGALYGTRPAPADEIWINDSDIIVVTKKPIQTVNEVVQQYFTRGLYSILPQYAFGDFSLNSFDSLD